MKKKAYARAGVDIDLGNQVKATLPELLASTHRPEVLGKVGGFGGLFALNSKKFKSPVLVSSVDGVGTKLKIAFATGKHDTIGADLVNHCVNDIAVIGAEPLFFLDYLGTGKLKPEVFRSIVEGFANGCRENRCALIGGETAQMPGFYQAGEYDVSGTIVGVAEKSRLLDGRGVKPGDVVLGIESNGLHTNGYSLARDVLQNKLKWRLNKKVAEFGMTLGEEMLRVHRSYGLLIQKLLKKYNVGSVRKIKALAHITGGGFIDNIPRALPSNCNVRIRKGSWDGQAVFDIIGRAGKVAELEMYQVFNMGIGMTLIVSADKADAVLRSIKGSKYRAWTIGEVTKGKGVVELVD